jgi:two-component system, sensor histidine kinase and response regulator
MEKEMLAMIVDDNELNRKIASKMLKDLGFEVTSAGKGIEALQFFNERKPCLILLDCKMPDMDGFEVAAKIRQIESVNDLKRTLIIAVSGDNFPENIRLCKESGMDDFVAKPININELKNIINKFREKIKEPESPLDIKTLMSSADYDKDWAEELLELFLRDTDERVVEIENALENFSDKETITRNFHTIKSSAASIGADKLAQFAKEFEEISKHGTVDAISEKMNIFKDELKKVEDFIKSGCKDLK